MTRHLLTALALLSVASVAVPRAGQAQTFKVEKFDIKGEGGTDYVTVESATGRVFVSRSTRMMVIEGATGKVLGDIPNLPGVHGAGIVTKVGHGFTTNSGDQTVTMFDLKTLAVLEQIKLGPGLDGIMYDEPDDKVILTNHSRPIGTPRPSTRGAVTSSPPSNWRRPRRGVAFSDAAFSSSFAADAWTACLPTRSQAVHRAALAQSIGRLR